MKTTHKIMAAALVAATPVALPVAATAQVAPGIAVANPDAIVVNSAAYKLAEQQRQTTYKPQLDQAEQRRAAIEAQLQPLLTKYQTDAQAASPNQASLQQQAQQIQRIQQSGEAELNRILQPLALSRAYVLEQISDRLPAAMEAAQKRRKITLVLNPAAVVAADQAYNLNQDVLTELDRALPQAQLVPPANWKPAAQRQAEAQQAAAAQGNAAATGGR
ncbi:OmpH family outer membrane protein [Croceicoccus naphthovorans]|uniref:Membrane protein n=1 Tax=Croceicoccus naphthovorans TaxID=1348774 RepID=A0A0G3XJR0_9SPHN|nr:OmpH family outer membrane protein [Croceicoccus naphthovorans]AKM10593.1 membrane protein [Croceicoccus naphthovorans]MBB3988812.1 Skp family chaperone for outer membrane proteins [Croceicoccus naphthovorans]